ncbi:hypothetical protein [Limosilactobacillus mucosae]|uniref:Uncharacterized protein n=1 Tax=Limosilactobacillus mucosae TaxID=97478 RepID=A0AAJ1HPA4_LIMMU|nr:hypothetical protein [Limosilactobacillus mucosae]MDC2826967.1 hypothetical protein [Limosilactobacillus mucosae]MDC2834682.1 hypothetical protein [Limosilactobacillus mucosae]
MSKWLLTEKNISSVKIAMHDLQNRIEFTDDDLMALMTIGVSLIRRLQNGIQFQIDDVESNTDVVYLKSKYRFIYKKQLRSTNNIALFLLNLINVSHIFGAVLNAEQIDRLLRPFEINSSTVIGNFESPVPPIQ